MLTRLLAVVSAVVLLIGYRTGYCTTTDWLPVSDVSLLVKEGSALDFSSLVDKGPAGRYGWARANGDGKVVFENNKTPQRFLIASLTFVPPNGGFPDHNDAVVLAEQLRRTGYNAVRFHYVDAMLMTKQLEDFDFDDEQFDRLQYLLFQLKRQGIYWVVDGLTSDNAGWGDVFPHRWVKKHRTKLQVIFSLDGLNHWKRLVSKIWGVRNPYTGLIPLQDPAMLGVILVNEGGLGFLATVGDNKYPSQLASLFTEWLKRRYSSNNELIAKWGGVLKRGESLSSVVHVPTSIRGNDMRSIDFAKFLVDAEQKAFKAMEGHLRKSGFRGLTTAYNNWPFINSDITRSALPWIDMHSYHVEPSKHGEANSKIDQLSIHESSYRYVRELANARHWGKPFTVTEYGQPFWNKWRHETFGLLPAIASLQNWDAISQFAEVAFQSGYSFSTHSRRQAIYPFGVGADPITRAGERLAAMLFLRADVDRAKGRIHFQVPAEKILDRSGGWEQIPERWGMFGLVTGIGLDFGQVPKKARNGIFSVDLGSGNAGWSAKLENALTRRGLLGNSNYVGTLKAEGIIDSNNKTNIAKRLFESETGQILVNGAAQEITVATPKTVVLTTQGSEIERGVLAIYGATTPASYAISSLDGNTLQNSRRMLLWILTDAINTGMTFEDNERTTLRNLGVFPPMLQPINVRIRIASAQANSLNVWALSLAGERRELLILEKEPKFLTVQIDTRQLTHGPSIFFEIASE